MTRDEVVGQVQRWQQLWAAREMRAVADLYAEDCHVRSPIFGDIRGRTALDESNRKLLTVFPDWDMKVEDLLVDGDRVAQHFKVSATHKGEFMGLPGTGRKAQFEGVIIMSFADGLIKQEMRLYDFTLVLLQVGVLRGKPGH